MRSFLPVVAVLSSLACAPTWTGGVADPRATSRSGQQPQTGSARPVAGAAPQSSDEVAIADLEDRRSLGDGRLEALALTASDPVIRRRAFVALGRIQESATIDTLVKGLGDPDPGTRSEVAFAAGLMGLSWVPLADAPRTRLTDAVLDAESAETDGVVKLALLEALGRLGGAPSVERLGARVELSGDVQSRAVLSLGVAAKNGTPIPTKTFGAVVALLKKDLPPATRYGAAFALMQSKNPLARAALLAGTADDASEVRALCAKGLGEVGTDVDAVTLKRLIDDPDYRVAVEATRALAKLAVKCKTAACPAIGALGDLSSRAERLVRGDSAGGGQPLLALAQAPLPVSAKALLTSLRGQLAVGKAAPDQRVRQDVANLDCRLAAAVDRLNGTLAEVLSCGSGLIDEPRRLSLGLRELATVPAADPNRRAAEVGSYVFHADPKVKLAAVELLAETRSPASIEKVRTQLNSSDLVLAAAAASALAKLGDKASIPVVRALAQKAVTQVDVAPVIADALATFDAKDAIGDLESWLGSTNATIRHSAAEALTKLKGQPVFAPRVERPVDGVRAPSIPADARLLVTTEKGEFEIALFTREAPLTSTNLYTLARRGYFRNLTFHRVVPDFVVQGGDPRGDGEGGPGYSIRCEINRKPYARGVVGMALSGKDTGGSQFFVTAAPQPWLDGRYTSFGSVTRGQEVVDALLEGDRITEIRASP
jgi:cyclophilin family peptidyl-prolyl cis-trans isomerase/HEAT repeat protein